MTSPRPRPRPRPPAPPVVTTPAVAPRAVAPRAVAPRAVAPRAVAPRAVAPRAVAPPVIPQPPAVPPRTAGPEYAETLVAPAQLGLGGVVALAAAAILLALGLWPLAILAVLLVVAVTIYLGVQSLTVTPTRISIGQGRGDTSPHTIETSEVAATDVVTLTWPQCFGLHLPDTVDTSRFTVRAGQALSLTMRDGEQIRISAANPESARAVLGR